MKKTRILILLLELCVILSACQGFRGGPTVYCIGGTWETDENAITLTAASSAESYTCPDGTVLVPYDGKIFMVVECSAELAEGWKIADDLVCYRHHNGGLNGDYGLFCDPISLGGSEYVLLFSVPADVYTGDPGDYNVGFVIEQSENVRRSQEFRLEDI